MRYAAYCLLVVSLLALLRVSIIPGTVLTPDSNRYLEYADNIYSGNPITAFSSVSLGTPLYPFILVLGKCISGDIILGAQLAHFVFLIATVIGSAYILRPLVPWWISVSATVVGLLPSCFFFNAILTEWISICTTTLLGACLVRYYHRREDRWLNACALLVASTVLVRPAMISFLPVILFVMCSLPYWKGRIIAVVFLSAPLAVWMFFHWYSYGTFKISDLGSIAFFGASTIYAQTDPLPGDPPMFRMFSEEFNRNKYRRTNLDETPLRESTIADKNMWQVADGIRVAHGWSYTELSGLCALYYQRLFRENFGEILNRWWHGIRRIPEYLGNEFFICLISLFYCMHLKSLSKIGADSLPFLSSLFIMFIFFLSHTATSAAAHPLIIRHFLLGWNTFVSSAILTAAALAYHSIAGSKAGDSSTRS